MNSFDVNIRTIIQKLYDCLKLLGVECIIVGIRPNLAINIKELKNISTFSSGNLGLKYIIERQNSQS
nr:hypothetical protein [Bacillus sp. OV322]